MARLHLLSPLRGLGFLLADALGLAPQAKKMSPLRGWIPTWFIQSPNIWGGRLDLSVEWPCGRPCPLSLPLKFEINHPISNIRPSVDQTRHPHRVTFFAEQREGWR